MSIILENVTCAVNSLNIGKFMAFDLTDKNTTSRNKQYKIKFERTDRAVVITYKTAWKQGFEIIVHKFLTAICSAIRFRVHICHTFTAISKLKLCQAKETMTHTKIIADLEEHWKHVFQHDGDIASWPNLVLVKRYHEKRESKNTLSFGL